jgi:hypothetical protein
MPSLISMNLAAASFIYFDTEFTDLLDPQLLSLGMVSAAGDEHYVELDLDDAASASTLSQASDFARHNGVLEQWGRVPGGSASALAMGERTARWLLERVARLGQPATIAFDYPADFELLECVLRDTGRWASVRACLRPLNVAELASPFEATLCAEAAYEALRRRGLERHHALADAHALRAACIATLTGKRVRL